MNADYDDDELYSETIQLEDLSFGEQVDLILEALWMPQYEEWYSGESDRELYGVEEEFDESTLTPQKHQIAAKMDENRVVTITWIEEIEQIAFAEEPEGWNDQLSFKEIGKYIKKLEGIASITSYQHQHLYKVSANGSAMGGYTTIINHLPGYKKSRYESGDEYAFIDWSSADPIG